MCPLYIRHCASPWGFIDQEDSLGELRVSSGNRTRGNRRTLADRATLEVPEGLSAGLTEQVLVESLEKRAEVAQQAGLQKRYLSKGLEAEKNLEWSEKSL